MYRGKDNDSADAVMHLRYRLVADPTGFEPAVSDVTGRRVRPLHYGSPLRPHHFGRGKEDSIIKRSVLSTGKFDCCWANWKLRRD